MPYLSLSGELYLITNKQIRTPPSALGGARTAPLRFGTFFLNPLAIAMTIISKKFNQTKAGNASNFGVFCNKGKVIPTRVWHSIFYYINLKCFTNYGYLKYFLNIDL